MHDSSSFLTLTYDDAHLPPGGSLDYSHVVEFMKNLRRRLDRTEWKSRISFYRVGEYGSNFSRPHYHLIIFGFDFRPALKYLGTVNSLVPVSTKDDRTYYKSSLATDLWSRGFVDIGDVDFATTQYVAKYVTKKTLRCSMLCLWLPSSRKSFYV